MIPPPPAAAAVCAPVRPITRARVVRVWRARVCVAQLFADWWCDRFGFVRVAYKGLETGSRDVCTHVVRNGDVVYAISSQLNPRATECCGDEMGRHLALHGDGVKDVAFRVTDCAKVYASLMARGGVSVAPPTESKDEFGSVVTASIATYGETIHTLVQRSAYSGPFLPGFRAVSEAPSAIATCTPPVVFCLRARARARAVRCSSPCVCKSIYSRRRAHARADRRPRRRQPARRRDARGACVRACVPCAALLCAPSRTRAASLLSACLPVTHAIATLHASAVAAHRGALRARPRASFRGPRVRVRARDMTDR
jgi:hypothetical protein